MCYPFAEDDELALLLVMDGHGPEGEKVRRRPPMHPMMHLSPSIAQMMMMMMHAKPDCDPAYPCTSAPDPDPDPCVYVTLIR